MKTKIMRILGVLVTVATMMTLIGVAPVSAATQAWSELTTPTAANLVLPNNIISAGPMAQAKDASAIWVAISQDTSSPADGVADVWKIVKTTDGGRTWPTADQVTLGTTAAAGAVALAASPTEANVLYYANASTIFKSVDGGKTFVAEANAAGVNSLAVAQLNNRYLIVFGTSTVGAVPANVYYFDEADPFFIIKLIGTNTFAAAVAAAGGGLVTDVRAVALSPNFATDRAVVAIGTDGANTYVMTDVFGGAWGAIVGSPAALPGAATTAAIAFPSDFNVTTAPNFFFGLGGTGAAVTTTTGDGIYRVNGAPTPGVSVVYNLTNALTFNSAIVTLDVAGTFAAANIVAGNQAGGVLRSSDAGATWSNRQLNTSADANRVYVMYKEGATTPIYILVGGTATVAGDDIAFYNFNGTSYHAVSLINNTNEIKTLEVAPNGELFMVGDSADNTDFLWRYFGGFWERVYHAAAADELDIVRVDPAYATSNALFAATYNSTDVILRSTNNGDTFTAIGSAAGSTVGVADPVLSMIALNANSVVVGSAGVITQTSNNGFIWNEQAVATMGLVTDLRVASNGDILAAGTGSTGAPRVARALAATPTVWTVGNTITALDDAPNSVVYVAPAADYATSGVVYVAANGDAGIYWGTVSSTATWTPTNQNASWYQPIAGATGLVTSAGGPGFTDEGTGMVYAAVDGGVARGKGRVATTVNSATEFIAAPVISGTSTPVTALFTNATANTVGNVVLYSIVNIGLPTARIYTYTDTLGKAVTGVAASNIVTSAACAEGNCLNYSTSATLKWDAVANANNYVVVIGATQATNFYEALASVAAGNGGYVTSATTLNVTGLPSDATSYVSVWAVRFTGTGSLSGTAAARATTLTNAALSSFGMGATIIAPPGAPNGLAPSPAAINQPTTPVFQWNPVTGATGYKLQVADNAAFTTPLVDQTVTGTSFAVTTPLAAGKAYFWRVAAVTPSGTSAYMVNTFTTAPAQATQPITIIAPTQSQAPITVNIPTITMPQITLPPISINIPTPTITLPPGTTTVVNPVVEVPEPATPAYIWIIVAVGALLTIAVIVLIVRTRRVV